MVQVLSATIFLLLLARLLRMPPGAWRFILGGAVLVLAGTQLLPVGTPLREDVRSSMGTLLWVGLAALPVLGYGLLIRTIRRRTLPEGDRESGSRPRGLVIIPDDAALVRDTEAALARERGGADDRISVAWRDDEGGLAGHARCHFHDGAAELELLWVAPAARGHGIGSHLLDQAETEARLRGAKDLTVATRTDEGARFFSRHGFRPYAAIGQLRYLHKPLP